MKAVRIANALPKPLGAPDDWDPEKNGHCGGLFIRPEEIGGVQFMRSAWEAEPNEAALMMAGAKLIVGISGNVHPVLHLGVDQLPEDFEPLATARKIVAMDGQAGVRVEMLFCHGGGKRGFIELPLEGTSFAKAVADGIEQIEAMATERGWIA